MSLPYIVMPANIPLANDKLFDLFAAIESLSPVNGRVIDWNLTDHDEVREANKLLTDLEFAFRALETFVNCHPTRIEGV